MLSWESVLSTLQEFVPSDIPDPLQNFPDFVCTLYSHRSIFAPKTASDCLLLLDKSHVQRFAPFVLYECPQFLLDPLVFYRAILALRDERVRTWRALTTVPGMLEALFEVHAGGLQPIRAGSSAEIREHRLYVAELLYSLIRENAKSHARVAPLIVRFVDAAIRVIGTAPLELAATLLRYILPLMRKMLAKSEKDQVHTFAWHLIRSLDRVDSPLFLMTVKFLLMQKPSVISAARIIKMISVRGIRSLSDIMVVSALADGALVVPALTFFCRSALLRKLWHRACLEQIRVLLLSFSARADVKDFFQVFIQRLFVFVALSAKQNFRYGGRALLICESLASLLNVKVLWLQQSVISGASSIIAIKSYPAYFKSFFPLVTSIDNIVLGEYDAFLGSDLPLKTFPFDLARGTLVNLTSIESLVPRPLQRTCLTQRSARDPALKRPVQKKKSLLRRPRLTHSQSFGESIFHRRDRS
jgi:hypothetical protein